MQLLQDLGLGMKNAWLFSIIYGIASISIMLWLPKERRKRILTFPKFNSKIEKVFTGLALFIFGRGLIVYTIFIPIKLEGITFYVGSIIYLIGMLSSVYSMWFFSQADLSKPVTDSLFKITRHPMQIMSIIMWIGIGIASENIVIIIGALFLAVFSLPSFKAQERFCIKKYGDAYLDYMKRTPRYLFYK